ncbi:rCG40974 [Rattus norvegicus]|uniref:RCG40974 n=1 Tax=Rattus norvegicus TaxID=10116 RepID=A6KMM2_RAT|nr:rCG40974 [Rattus norvegicus]
MPFAAFIKARTNSVQRPDDTDPMKILVVDEGIVERTGENRP